MSDVPRTASDYFGGMVESYDSLIRRAVPRYDEMVERLVEYLPKTTLRVLELGCGTGNLTLKVLNKYPAAMVTSVDASPEMTALTAQRAANTGVGNQLRVITAKFEDFDAPNGSFELVTSSLSLHHVKDKAPVYAAIARWLRPGGVLAFADQMLGATEGIQQEHWDLWLRFCREPGRCTEAEIESLAEHSRKHDHYVPLADHFQMMAQVGFRALDCVWRNGMYGVVLATRSDK